MRSHGCRCGIPVRAVVNRRWRFRRCCCCCCCCCWVFARGRGGRISWGVRYGGLRAFLGTIRRRFNLPCETRHGLCYSNDVDLALTHGPRSADHAAHRSIRPHALLNRPLALRRANAGKYNSTSGNAHSAVDCGSPLLMDIYPRNPHTTEPPFQLALSSVKRPRDPSQQFDARAITLDQQERQKRRKRSDFGREPLLVKN